MKKIYLAVFFSILVVLLAHAHEFWLQPTTFFTKVGETVSIDVLVGEYFTGERSEGKKNRIVQYIHWVNGLQEDLSPSLTDGHYGAVPIKITKPGSHLIGFANTNKFLSMRADSFLLYLQEDGLNHIIHRRQQRRETHTASRELYRRCVKTLLQAGPVLATDKTYSLDTGMPLEIIPVQNPYSIKPGGWLDCKILFERKPLPNALVRYWNRPDGPLLNQKDLPGLKPNGLKEEQQRSDSRGQVRFQLRTGQNMISLVHMVPTIDTSEADWQSYWGSLTFGCR